MPIHPTALVSPQAELDPTVEVGPHAIIEQHVKIGAGTKVWPNAYITGHTEIGRDNQIHIGAVLGHEPQDLKFDRACRSFLKIGDRNVFREYVTVQRGTAPESATEIGHDCYLMANAHVGHNCIVGNHVIIVDAAMLGGHAQVNDRAIISGGTVVHQFCRVGRLALVSGNARLTADQPPFTLAAESNKVYGLNLVGLKRAGIPAIAISELKKVFRLYYRSGLDGTRALAEALEEGAFKTAEAHEFIEFIRASANGVCSWSRRKLLKTRRTTFVP